MSRGAHRCDAPPPPPWLHLSSAPGTGALSVFELFGAGSLALLEGCVRRAHHRSLRADRATLGVLVDAAGDAIDQVVVAHVDAAASWCGFDGWTVSSHGGAAVAERVTSRLAELGAHRRSTDAMLALGVQHGRCDRLRAEAFAALLRALTERAAGYFLRLHAGELSAWLAGLCRDLCAGRSSGAACIAALEGAERAATAAIRLDAPLRVLLAGPPNAGKSTLFNRLLGAERVVVSTMAGTTRDLVCETIEIAGYPVALSDSAGIRDLDRAGTVERLGIERTLGAHADAVLLLREDERPLSAVERRVVAGVPADRLLHVRTKADLGPAGPPPPGLPAALVVSSVSGAGLAELRDALRARWLGPPEAEPLPPLPFSWRQVADLQALRAELRRRLGADGGWPVDLDVVRRAFIECVGLGREYL